MATESGSSFDASWSRATASVHSPLVFQGPGRGIQAHRLGPPAIVHRRGPERDDEAGRVVARLAEEGGELRSPIRWPRGGTARGWSLHLLVGLRLRPWLGTPPGRRPEESGAGDRDQGYQGRSKEFRQHAPIVPPPVGRGFPDPVPPRTRVHRVRRPTQHPEPGGSHARRSDRLSGIGRGGSSSPRRLLNPMIPVVRVSYHGTARAAKTSGVARFRVRIRPALRPTSSGGKLERLTLLKLVRMIPPGRRGRAEGKRSSAHGPRLVTAVACEPNAPVLMLRFFPPPRRGSHKSAQGNALGTGTQKSPLP